MAYTKYSLTPANNNAAPPDGAPEGMLPSAVNDTMRDMMAQIRDVGDGIRGGTYTMTAPVITGGSITGVALSGNTFTSPIITGGSINNTPIGASTANTGAFTTLGATGVATFSAGTVSAPAITTTGDTNTGIFFPAADTIAFTEGGVESMRITSAGDVGIGTSSPTSFGATYRTLEIKGSGSANGGYCLVTDGAGTTTAQLGVDGNAAYIGTRTNHPSIFTTNNTERMRITAAGNVGIGTSSPTAITNFTSLSVNGTTGTLWDAYVGGTIVNRLDCRSGEVALNSYGTLAFGTGSGSTAERMRITSTGDVGIGTSSPATKLDVGGGGEIRSTDSTVQTFMQSSAGAAGGYMGTRSNHFLQFRTNNADVMRIDSSGNVGIGQVTEANSTLIILGTNNSKIQVNHNSSAGQSFFSNGYSAAGTGWHHFNGVSSNNSIQNILIYGNGNIVNANNSYGAISDIKLKENIVDATPKLDKLMQVRIRNYNLKGDYEQHKQLGVVAQELEQIFPSLVEETADKDVEGKDLGTTTKGVKYSVFVPMLIKAMQEQQVMIEQLTTRLNALEGK
jgi:hypothetical protein